MERYWFPPSVSRTRLTQVCVVWDLFRGIVWRNRYLVNPFLYFVLFRVINLVKEYKYHTHTAHSGTRLCGRREGGSRGRTCHNHHLPSAWPHSYLVEHASNAQPRTKAVCHAPTIKAATVYEGMKITHKMRFSLSCTKRRKCCVCVCVGLTLYTHLHWSHVHNSQGSM